MLAEIQEEVVENSVFDPSLVVDDEVPAEDQAGDQNAEERVALSLKILSSGSQSLKTLSLGSDMRLSHHFEATTAAGNASPEDVVDASPEHEADRTFLVPVGLLRDRNNVRVAFNRLEQLAQSLRNVGQLQSVLVVPDALEDGCWEVKSGGRRLRAARDVLNWENLRCRQLNLDSLHAELAALDSNLENDALKGADLDFALARQKKIYEILYPETMQGYNQPKEDQTAKRFTQTKAEQLGVSETVVKDAIRRAEGLSDAAKVAYKQGALDKTEATVAAGLSVAVQDSLLAKAFAAASPEEARTILRAGLKEETKKKRLDRQEKRLTKLLAETEGNDSAPTGIDLRYCRVRELVETWKGEAALVHADPAWTYDNQRLNGTTDSHYESDGMADITVMLDKAYDRAAKDTYLLLWVPIPLLKEWFDVSAGDEMRWQYKSGGVWGKTGRKGIGHHWRGDAEMLLLYVKGKPQPFDSNQSNLYVSARTEHSEKPQEWLEQLVGAFCPEKSTVMDLWAGLGSMARACARQGRGYIGAESDAARHREARLLLAKQEN